MRDVSERLRDIQEAIAHFGIDLEVIWEVVERDLPVLQASVDAILAGQEGTSNA